MCYVKVGKLYLVIGLTIFKGYKVDSRIDFELISINTIFFCLCHGIIRKAADLLNIDVVKIVLNKWFVYVGKVV